jgi:hypothetical protein
MPAATALIWRSGELKRELLDFARKPRYRRAFQQALERRFGEAAVQDEGESANFLDYFVLQNRLSDGRTLVEHFVDAHPDLLPSEREMLLGWQDVVEGIFAVQRQDSDALIVVNLIDELTYRVHSNMGPAIFTQMPAGSFLIARLVPIADEWLLSGSQGLLPRADHAGAYRLAAELAAAHPSLVFRNPHNVERAWELQREERRTFIAFFGSDLIVLPGKALAERMQAYMQFRLYESRDDEGESAADRAKHTYGAAPPLPDLALPGDLQEAETVAVIYDEVDGLNFLADFGRVEAAFANPELVARTEYGQMALAYLEDSSVSPRVLRRLADRNPERASRVFQQVLKRPRFSWDRDGEALLRRYKASYFQRPVLPSITPLSETLARAHLTASSALDPAPGRRGSAQRSSRRKRRK